MYMQLVNACKLQQTSCHHINGKSWQRTHLESKCIGSRHKQGYAA
jgi:hypothetical protein